MNEKEFDDEFEITLTKEEMQTLYGVYSLEDLDRID